MTGGGAGAAGDCVASTGACVAAEDGGDCSATSTGWGGGAGSSSTMTGGGEGGAGDCAALTGASVAAGDGGDCSTTSTG